MRGDPLTSPIRIYQESGLPDGSVTITVDVFFDPATLILAASPAVRVVRLATCPWNTLVTGNGRKEIPIPVGTTNLTRAQMNSQGFTTLDDVRNFDITLTTR